MRPRTIGLISVLAFGLLAGPLLVEAQQDVTLLAAHFDADEDGFSYVDDPFRSTSEPIYTDGVRIAAGGFAGGALQVTLGGIDDADILGMSGGWQRSFSLSQPTDIVVSFRYNLTQASDYESDELGQVLMSVDGILIGQAPDDYVAQIVGNGNGGVPETTGWRFFQVNLGTLPAGDHTLVIGGYSNKKTLNTEKQHEQAHSSGRPLDRRVYLDQRRFNRAVLLLASRGDCER